MYVSEHVPEIPMLHPPITHDNQTVLHWDRRPSTENHTVIYIIQHQLNTESDWLSLGWVSTKLSRQHQNHKVIVGVSQI